MKRSYFACLFLCLATTFSLSQSNPVPLIGQKTRVAVPTNAPHSDPQAQARILNNYGKLPLSFEANHGQSDPRVKFLSRTGRYTLFLTGDEAVLALSGKKASPNNARIVDAAHTMKPDHAAPESGGVLHMKLRNANPSAKITGVDELLGTSNYFIGNDSTKWQTNVPIYAKVKYEGIYKGVDLVYYGNQRQLEYDFIVAPGADPSPIAFDFLGTKWIRRDAHGDLVLDMGKGEVRWHKPLAYQEKDGQRQEIAANYAITDKNHVGFKLAEYDASRPLYIDPLVYSTYLGGSGGDMGVGIAVDSAGSAYVSGFTTSTNFPVTSGAIQTTYGGDTDAFVAKLNPSGSALVYSTYLGGSGQDQAEGIAVDSAGNAYVSGFTTSTNFPVTSGAIQTTYGGNTDAFAAKLNPLGSALVYSTYLGGSGVDGQNQGGNGIAVDSVGDAYVTGFTQSTDFPVTPGAFQTTYGTEMGVAADAFVTEINPLGSALVYSTYLGSGGNTAGNGIAVDSVGDAHVIGTTSSTNFPVTPGAFQTTYAGGDYDAFVTDINHSGSALVYSTYLGGSGMELGYGIVMDNAGNAYITGFTQSTDFPITPGAFQTICNGGIDCASYGDAFVAEINPSGSALVYSTYLGGSSGDYGLGIAVDSIGDAYVVGLTRSTNFPVTPGAFQTVCSGCNSSDAFVAEINPSGSALVYSTYLGGSTGNEGNGIAVDSAGNAYVSGWTASTDFPVTSGVFQTVCGGTCAGNAFVAKIGSATNSTTIIASSSNPSSFGQSVRFTAGVNSQGSGTPTGTVAFTYGSTTLCSAVALSGGRATCQYSALPVGPDIVTAAYSGDSNFAPSSGTVSQTVAQASTTLTLISSLNPSGLDSPVTFTATIAPQYGGQATGAIIFKDGTTTLGSSGVGGNVASLTTSGLAIGTHSITAVYSGDSNFTGSASNIVSQVVTKATTTTALVSSANPSVQGKSVTFTASVSSLAGTPTGKVQFLNGKTVLATVKLTSGSAKYTTSKLPPGANSITAVYEGDSENNGSTSPPVDQFVIATTTTALLSSPNPSTFGQVVTFTAVVAPAPPDGETVSFMKGKTVLGTGTLSSGSVSLATSTLKVGTTSVTAVYGGDSNFAGSKSDVVKQVVEKAGK